MCFVPKCAQMCPNVFKCVCESNVFQMCFKCVSNVFKCFCAHCGISKLTTHTAHTGAHHAHRRTPRTPRTPAHTTHTEVIGGPKYVYTYERLARRFVRSAGVATYMLAVSACTSCIIVINYVKIIYTKCGPFSYPRNCGYILLHSAVTSSVSLSDALSKL